MRLSALLFVALAAGCGDGIPSYRVCTADGYCPDGVSTPTPMRTSGLPVDTRSDCERCRDSCEWAEFGGACYEGACVETGRCVSPKRRFSSEPIKDR